EDYRLHMEVGPRSHRRNQGHHTLPLNAKRRNKTHPSARRILEKLGGEKDKGRTHRRLDFLSEEAPRARSGTMKPSAGQQANPPEDGALIFETESPRITQRLYASPSLAMGDSLL